MKISILLFTSILFISISLHGQNFNEKEIKSIDSNNKFSFKWLSPKYENNTSNVPRKYLKKIKNNFNNEFVKNGWTLNSKTPDIFLQLNINENPKFKYDLVKNKIENKFDIDTVKYTEYNITLFIIDKNNKDNIKKIALKSFSNYDSIKKNSEVNQDNVEIDKTREIIYKVIGSAFKIAARNNSRN